MSTSEAELRKRAEAARDKKAALGEDIDLSRFREGAHDIPEVPSLEELSDDAQEAMLRSGVVPSGEGREGSLIVLDNSMVAHSAASKSYELMDIMEAGAAGRRQVHRRDVPDGRSRLLHPSASGPAGQDAHSDLPAGRKAEHRPDGA
jgi:hypothetical protein